MDALSNLEADQPSAEADQSDRIKPWTIKGIPADMRHAAIAAAEREGQTLGDWFARGIPVIIQQQRQQNRLPVPVDVPGRPSDPEADLAMIERLTALVKGMREASDVPPPKTLARLTYGLMRDRLRELKRAGRTEAPAEADQ